MRKPSSGVLFAWRAIIVVQLSVAVLNWGGCSGSAGSETDESASYSTRIGIATAFDFEDKTRRLLDLYQFNLVRHERTSDMIYLETEWKSRYPFEDEIQQGVEEARTRMTLQAIPRTRVSGGSDLNVVRLFCENMVRLRDQTQWQRVPMSKSLMDYLEGFAEDLRMEFRTGIRKF